MNPGFQDGSRLNPKYVPRARDFCVIELIPLPFQICHRIFQRVISDSIKCNGSFVRSLYGRDRLLLLANRLLLLANVLYCTPVLYVLLHVLLLYFNVLYIVAYSTYFRCILLYSMYSAEGECTPMYLGVLCCVSGVHVLHAYSECTSVVLCRLR